jgi:hypothetical protein
MQSLSLHEYYANRDVRTRMLEFLGGDSPENVTCHYLTVGDGENSGHRQPRSINQLPIFWEKEFDISRSLWDHESLLVHLDVEYVNFDFPAEPYLKPKRIFDLLRPVELAIEAVLLDYNIKPLHLLSGRGHHFVWRVGQDSSAFNRLANLGRVPPTLEKLNARFHRPTGEPVPSKLGAAFAGLALVMEHLAHRIKAEATPQSEIPIELTAVEVGPKQHGREMISIDISEYGDPLSTRVIRVPFSRYLKPLQQRKALGEDIVRHLPSMFLIPLDAMDVFEGIETMRDIDKVSALAKRSTTKIPDESHSTETLIDSYENSDLKCFHDKFYTQEPEPPERWPQTYDRTSFDPMPLCTRHVLEHPNDLLLRPGNIRRLVRVLLALGWHPRHIAGLIRSRFERDHHWGAAWLGYDAATRADFYTRVFAGLAVTGQDDLVDFNCQSANEEKLCGIGDCPLNLLPYKQSLLKRRTYERLARRPFHRLFLPEEHL